jgi:hypothetical protein
MTDHKNQFRLHYQEKIIRPAFTTSVPSPILKALGHQSREKSRRVSLLFNSGLTSRTFFNMDCK